MTEREQANQFEKEVNRVLEHFRQEYELPYAAAIGVLEIIKHQLIEELLVEEDD
jgi:hypothetical protein